MADLIRTDTVLGGRKVIVGELDKDIVLQTKGHVKVQQGSKFIDLIKDGGLNIPKTIIPVNTFDDIGTATAFYYVRDENAIYAVVEGNLVDFFGGTGGGGGGGSSTGVDNLADLKDVSLFNLSNGDFLVYSNGYWTNSLFNIKDLEIIREDFVDQMTNLANQIRYTQRTWADVLETLEMMFDPESNYFTEVITPIAVHTAQLIVGTNSQQFDLVNITFQPNYNKNYNDFRITKTDANQDSYLLHNTYTRDGDDPDGNKWFLGAQQITLPTDDPYYVFARCDRYSSTGTIVVDTQSIIVEPETDRENFYFWIGVLNSPQAGINDPSGVDGKVRSWQPMHGFTEITGQYITTGVIKDKTGSCYWDMIDGMFRMGNDSTYIFWDGTTLHIKGRLIQDDPNYTNYIINWRGNFVNSSGVRYEPGDVVFYNGSAYVCIRDCYGNILPTNTSYWNLLTAEGTGWEFRFKLTTTITRPGNPDQDSSWSATNNLQVSEQYPYLWVAYRSYTTNSTSGRVYSAWVVTLMSTRGEDGEIGPTMVFRGTYEAASVTPRVLYYANARRTDIVKYGTAYYIANYKRLKDTNFGINGFNVAPPSGTLVPPELGVSVPAWVSFGASFSSVATDLLFAQTALIAGWNFYDNYIWSEAGGVVLHGNADTNTPNYRWNTEGGYTIIQDTSTKPAIMMGRGNNGTSPIITDIDTTNDGSESRINIANSRLRLYEAGVMYGENLWFNNCNIGTGQIGGFTISNGYLLYSAGSLSATYSFSYVAFNSSNANAYFGTNVNFTGSVVTMARLNHTASTSAYKYGLSINVSGASSSYENLAIYAESGNIITKSRICSATTASTQLATPGDTCLNGQSGSISLPQAADIRRVTGVTSGELTYTCVVVTTTTSTSRLAQRSSTNPILYDGNNNETTDYISTRRGEHVWLTFHITSGGTYSCYAGRANGNNRT